MPQPPPKVSQYELAHYAQFAGKQIVRVELVEIERGFDMVPTFTFHDGTAAQVWRDPECSGAGWVCLIDEDGNEIIPKLRTGDFEKK